MYYRKLTIMPSTMFYSKHNRLVRRGTCDIIDYVLRNLSVYEEIQCIYAFTAAIIWDGT